MIFVDTSFLIALLISTDQFHEKALKISQTINERKVINNTVLNETLNSFTGKGGKVGKDLYYVIMEMFDIQYLTPDDYEEAIDIYLYYDSSINYSDCTILSTMFQNNISRIVSFDSDFEKISGVSVIN
ncbi:type II toxin-antitoxin system VapC family toxin [Methanobrevibacter sp.]|uniref:type II toxin-antitoxin system VapC family toxin n=1 Tax=Methanobrevibacter sp. TaxID=66852 RepID=UPI00388D083C